VLRQTDPAQILQILFGDGALRNGGGALKDLANAA
jgi:hypothetical protein